MRDGYVLLCRKPHIFKEYGCIRWPRVLAFYWRSSFELGAEVSYDWDSDDPWKWMLHLHVGWLQLFLHFPAPGFSIEPYKHRGYPPYGESFNYGFDFRFKDDFGGGLWLHWGLKNKYLKWPWIYEHHRTEVQRADGSWVLEKPEWRLAPGEEGDGRKEYVMPYRYVQKWGEVQARTCTFYVRRAFRRRRWLKWTAWRERKWQSIDFRFDGEVGSETGSWKGGVIGSSETMRPGETPIDTFNRMQAERRFDRR